MNDFEIELRKIFLDDALKAFLNIEKIILKLEHDRNLARPLNKIILTVSMLEESAVKEGFGQLREVFDSFKLLINEITITREFLSLEEVKNMRTFTHNIVYMIRELSDNINCEFKLDKFQQTTEKLVNIYRKTSHFVDSDPSRVLLLEQICSDIAADFKAFQMTFGSQAVKYKRERPQRRAAQA